MSTRSVLYDPVKAFFQWIDVVPMPIPDETQVIDFLDDTLPAVSDRWLLESRFGLDNEGMNPPLTLAEIGDALDLTRERVRQLEQKLLPLLKGDVWPTWWAQKQSARQTPRAGVQWNRHERLEIGDGPQTGVMAWYVSHSRMGAADLHFGPFATQKLAHAFCRRHGFPQHAYPLILPTECPMPQEVWNLP